MTTEESTLQQHPEAPEGEVPAAAVGADLTALELLAHLRSLDLSLWLEGDRLRWSAPRGVATPELLARLKERKEELVALLRPAGAGTVAPPILPVPREGRLPLSYSQARLWFLAELEPDEAAYNLPEAVRMAGPLVVARLGRCLAELVRRHESLRTTFEAEAGEPYQVIGAPFAPPLPVVELTALAAGDRAAAARRLARRHGERLFELARGPLIRTALLRLAPREHWFLLSIHHLVFDRWSMGVFIREVEHLYRAFHAGEPPALPELTLHYADFAAWQREWLQGEAAGELLAYWRQELADAPPVLELPLDRPRPPVRSSRGAMLPIALPPALADGVRELGNRLGATPFMVLMAAFKALLARYTGRTDLPVGSLIANRNRREIEGVIGFFVNTLVVRTRFPDDPSFLELVRRVRTVTLGAYAHQDLPFEMLLEELQPDREMSTSPVFQVMLVFQNTPAPELRLPELEVSRLELDHGVWSQCDWTLWMWPEEEGIGGYLDYNPDLFDASTLQRMLGHYRTLLTAAVAAPEERSAGLPVMPPGERHQLLSEWNDVGAAPAPGATVPTRFARQVAARPDAVAAEAGDELLSYGELERRTGRLAARLPAAGSGPEEVVPLLAERGLDLLTAIVGVMRAGGAYLPLDPRHPAQRLAQVLAAAQPRLVLVGEGLGGALAESLALLPAGERPRTSPIAELWGPAAETEEPGSGQAAPWKPPHGVEPHQLAYVIFTSGSTGVPKAPMVHHRGLLLHLDAMAGELGLGRELRFAQNASQCFDISVWQFVGPLLLGGRVVILPDEVAHHGRRLLEEVERRRITLLEVVPSLMRAMLDEAEVRSHRSELAALGWLLSTGEALAPELARRWLTAFPDPGLFNAYGPAECSDDVAGGALALPADGGPPQVTLGGPLAGSRLYVLSADLRPAPLGAFGELGIAGRGVGRGYHRDPRRTAEAFVPDPFAVGAGERLYRTGDAVRWLPGGQLDFCGRIDQQVKVRGFRIELGEVEVVLSRHPAVAAAVAAVWEDETSGDRRLVAYLVPAPGGEVDGGEVRAFLKERLPEYMVPAAFVSLPELPLNASGKVDRKRLPAPEWSRAELGREYRPPGSPVEEILAEIFAQVLRCRQVGVDDNFFELGGHSLLVTQVVARASDAFDVEIPVRTLFEAPTVAELAVRVEEKVLATIDELDDQEVEALL